jgi:hypothetical protein
VYLQEKTGKEEKHIIVPDRVRKEIRKDTRKEEIE